MVTADQALAALEAEGDATRATELAAYMKAPRRYLGVPVPLIEDCTRLWRAQATLDERLAHHVDPPRLAVFPVLFAHVGVLVVGIVAAAAPPAAGGFRAMFGGTTRFVKDAALGSPPFG